MSLIAAGRASKLVLGAPHLPHAPAAQRNNQPVAAELARSAHQLALNEVAPGQHLEEVSREHPDHGRGHEEENVVGQNRPRRFAHDEFDSDVQADQRPPRRARDGEPQLQEDEAVHDHQDQAGVVEVAARRRCDQDHRQDARTDHHHHDHERPLHVAEGPWNEGDDEHKRRGRAQHAVANQPELVPHRRLDDGVEHAENRYEKQAHRHREADVAQALPLVLLLEGTLELPGGEP